MSNVAMSTSWNAKRHDGAMGVVDEILSLGIDNLEVGYSTTSRQLQQLVEMVPGGMFHVVSVHNFCPIPPDHTCNWGDDSLLSSLDEQKREQGVRSTLQTIHWAEVLGAGVVVMHLGAVAMEKKRYAAIKQLVVDRRANGDILRSLVRDVKRERERLAGPHLDAVRRTLDGTIPRLPRSIRLGLECRYDYYSIPILEEMAELLAEYGAAVGYWHDIGHAHAQENMGFYEDGAYVKALGQQLIGMHVHDSAGISDHRAPGSGEMDLGSLLKPYMGRDTVNVLELHPRVTHDEAARGVDFLRSLGI